MSNELILAPEIKTPAPVSKEQASAWIGLATTKNQTVFELQRKELEAQGILITVQGKEVAYEAIDVALAKYRKHHTETMDLRKAFTSLVDANIIQPLMEFEKRIDPKNNQPYQELINRSLTLRKAESDKAALVNAKNSEIAAFKAHIVNEFSRVVTEYRATIRREFTKHYNLMLTDKVEDPMLEKVKEFAREIMPPAVAKFNARYLPNEELMQIYTDTPKPDYATYYADLMVEMDMLFANYSSDLANAEAAIKHQADAAKLRELEEANEAKEEQALNTLIATSETVIIDEPKIKKSVQVTVIESWAWANSVMATFMINEQKLNKYMGRVKSVAKLSIGQMATYLGQLATDEGISFKGLEMKEVEK